MRLLILLICFVLATSIGSAQYYPSIIKAFSDSYTHESNGEYVKGIEALKKVYDENNYEINLRLGWLHYMAGLFTESIVYYQASINVMPYAIEAKLGYVYPASALGNWDMVIAQYDDILVIDPNNTIVNYRLGLIYYGREEFTKASKYFEKVVNLYPFDYDGVIILAWTYLKLGKMRKAEVLFNKALMLSPNDKSAAEGLKLIK